MDRRGILPQRRQPCGFSHASDPGADLGCGRLAGCGGSSGEYPGLPGVLGPCRDPGHGLGRSGTGDRPGSRAQKMGGSSFADAGPGGASGVLNGPGIPDGPGGPDPHGSLSPAGRPGGSSDGAFRCGSHPAGAGGGLAGHGPGGPGSGPGGPGALAGAGIPGGGTPGCRRQLPGGGSGGPCPGPGPGDQGPP